MRNRPGAQVTPVGPANVHAHLYWFLLPIPFSFFILWEVLGLILKSKLHSQTTKFSSIWITPSSVDATQNPPWRAENQLTAERQATHVLHSTVTCKKRKLNYNHQNSIAIDSLMNDGLFLATTAALASI